MLQTISIEIGIPEYYALSSGSAKGILSQECGDLFIYLYFFDYNSYVQVYEVTEKSITEPVTSQQIKIMKK